MATFIVQITVETNASEVWSDLAKSSVVRAIATYCENSGWECVVNTADASEEYYNFDYDDYVKRHSEWFAEAHIDPGERDDREEDSRESAS